MKDRTKDGRVLHGGAVPPPVAELVLALCDPCPGTSPNRAHVILVELAEFGLARGEPWDLGAEGLGTHHVELRIPPHFIALDTQIPMVENKKTKESNESINVGR